MIGRKPKASKRRAVFVLGDSHYAALASAAEARLKASKASTAATGTESLDAALFIFNAWKYRLLYEFSVAKSGKWVMNPELQQSMMSLAGGFDEVHVVSMFGGAHNHALTMIEYKRPFDVYLQHHNAEPLIEGAEILSRNYVETALCEYLVYPFRQMKVLIEAIPNAVGHHIQSPPIVGDQEFAQAHMGEFFAKDADGDEAIVAPAYFRQKIWIIQSELFKHEAARLGYGSIAPPEQSMDEGGFLKSVYYSTDSTHANSAYGELLIQQLENSIDKEFSVIDFFG
ncbi:MAG: hypothetical protein AAGH82_06415 [Pseudomonadota bacterium]